MRQKTKLKRTGFSVVEVLVAMTVLSICLLACVTTMQTTNGLVRRGDNTAIATRLAADMVANFQANNVSLLADGTTTQAISALPGGSAQTTIAPYNNDSAEHFMKQIQVTITWQGSSGFEQVGGSISMFTYVSARK